MSIGNVKTYGSKWGTNYPWQKAMLFLTKQLAGAALLTDNFVTTMGVLPYTRPAIANKTISYVIDDTNGIILVDGVDYTVVGPIITFSAMPAAITIKILYN